MTDTLPVGTEITCPRKNHLVGTLIKDLNSGELLRLSTVTFEPGQEKVQGEKCSCAICNSLYFVDGMIHTSDGWKPNDPQLEPVPR